MDARQQTLAQRIANARPSALRLGVSTDVAKRLSSLSYLISASPVLLFAALGVAPEIFRDPALLAIAGVGLVAGTIGLAWPDGKWSEATMTMFNFGGYVLLAMAALTTPEIRIEAALLITVPTLLHCCTKPTKDALPFVVIAAAIVIGSLWTVPGSGSAAHAAIGAGVFAVLIAVLRVNEHRLRRLMAIVARISVTDPLTGLINVREFRSAAEVGLAETIGSSRQLAMIVADIDDFKQVNDRFSHSTGDSTLAAVGQALKEAIGEAGLTARRGGDEFVALVEVESRQHAARIAERVRRVTFRARMAITPSLDSGVSVGFALASHGNTFDHLLVAADAKLHEEKRLLHGEQVIERRGQKLPPPPPSHADHLAATIAELTSPRAARSEISIVLWAIGAWMMGLGALSGFATHTLLACAGLVAIGFIAAPRKSTSGGGYLSVVLVATLALVVLVVATGGERVQELSWLLLIPAALAARFARRRISLVIGLAVVMAHGLTVGVLGNSGSAWVSTWGIFALAVLMMGPMFGLLTTKIAEYAARCEHLSQTDPLTGLLNRRGLTCELPKLVATAETEGDRLGLIGIDLDGFKRVNDELGHSAGDDVLRRVGGAITDVVRPGDVVARRGGDEFVVVCARPDRGEIFAVADRLASQIDRARQDFCPNLPSTASVGVALHDPNQPLDKFLVDSDDHLHESKAQLHRRHDDFAPPVARSAHHS